MDADPDPVSGNRPPAPVRRRAALTLGALAAIGLGAAVALGLFRDEPAETDAAPAPAETEGGLEIDLAQAQGGERLDPKRPLRCFVDGEFVGELTVADCAKRNNVPTQGLDVGLDDTGALAAVVSVPGAIPDPLGVDRGSAPEPEPDPLPSLMADAIPPPTPRASPREPAGECLREVAGEWRTLGEALTLDTCVQVLFAGRCQPPGGEAYGRWNGQALRLIPGRVEIARPGAGYSALVQQDPVSCMLL